jgi:response regulator NasT
MEAAVRRETAAPNDRTGLRILLAEDDAAAAGAVRKQLQAPGFTVVGVSGNGEDAVRQALELRPDVVLMDIHMPGLDGIEAARRITESCPTNIIFLTGITDREMTERAAQTDAFGYLVKPVTTEQLQATVRLAGRRFDQFREVRRQVSDLKQALADRKVIERAKGILMARKGLTEEDAYKRIRLESHHRNKKMAEIAQTILDAEEFL